MSALTSAVSCVASILRSCHSRHPRLLSFYQWRTVIALARQGLAWLLIFALVLTTLPSQGYEAKVIQWTSWSDVFRSTIPSGLQTHQVGVERLSADLVPGAKGTQSRAAHQRPQLAAFSPSQGVRPTRTSPLLGAVLPRVYAATLAAGTPSTITSNFNATAIPAGRFIWFNSVLKASGMGSGPVKIYVRSASIQFSTDGVLYNLAVPDATVTYSPSATMATTAFDSSTNQWVTTVPTACGGMGMGTCSGNTFLSGVAFLVPTGGLPGGIDPVTWQGQFYTDTAGVTLQWQWAAAVYTSFAADYNGLDVKPIDGTMCRCNNSDHAGTPELYKGFVTGGARGGGGSNYTGSYSGTAAVTPAVGTPNSPPTANAGPDQTVFLQTTVQLDGTKSTDPNGDPLTYRWLFASRPDGSAATLTGANSSQPTFVVDVAGVYKVQLVVNDGLADSRPSTVLISTTNSPPVADAGPNQTVTVTTTVQLDGGKSHDVDGDPLTYQWSFEQPLPPESTASLSDPSLVNPTFIVDKPGVYTIDLTIDDGHVDHARTAKVTVSTINSPPVANAGPDQSIDVGTTVQLDGSKSTDVDGDKLTYTWSFESWPKDTPKPVLSDPAAIQPTFFASAIGTYSLQLLVNDGTVPSGDTVNIVTGDTQPIADPGPPQSVPLGSLVHLDGSKSSCSKNKVLTYQWALTTRPAISAAALVDATSATPSFTADAAGDYIVQLIVSDGYLGSDPVTVKVSTINSKPLADPGPAQTVTLGDTVFLSGANSQDADLDPLTYRWAILSPQDTQAVLDDPTSTTPSFVPDKVGLFVVQLIVNDGKEDSDGATVPVTVKPRNQAPVVSAGPDLTITLPVNSVTLNGAVTDDGLPNGTLTITWTGPDGVVFNSPNEAVTAATFPGVGTYQLQLTGDDSQLKSTSQVTITVNASLEQPPIVTAGLDQTVPFPNRLPLQGSVTSANTPPGKVAALWTVSKTEPDGLPVTFVDPTSPTTTVNLNAAGTYYLRLTGTENKLSASSVATITTVAGNRAPVVNAGPEQTVFFPASVSLSGTATDDGLPAGSVLTYQWTVLSGPGQVTFSFPHNLSTTALPTAAGDYLLQLLASDGQLTGSATVAIHVMSLCSAPKVSAGADQTIFVPSNAVFSASPTLQKVASLNSPVGIGYSPRLNRLIVSVTATTESQPNLVSLAADGSSEPFSTLSGITTGLYIAIAPDEGGGKSQAGFQAGDVFAGSGATGAILRVSADSNTVQNPWVTLPGETGVVTGQLRFDTTGTFGGALVAATTSGNVWLINAAGSPTLLAKNVATNPSAMMIVPNEPQNYGPWAGSIVIGKSWSVSVSSVSAKGIVNNLSLEFLPQNFVLVEPGKNYFAVDAGSSSIQAIASANLFYLYGDILVGEAAKGALWRVHWNGERFEQTRFAKVQNWKDAVSAAVPLGAMPAAMLSAQLQGTVTTDAGSGSQPVTTAWTQLSGPGTASFTDPTSPRTTATFTVPGAYVLQLTALGCQSASSTVTITVRGNAPPVVDPGPSLETTPGQSIPLQGNVTDDGLPNGAPYAFWSKVSGPGRITLETPSWAGDEHLPVNQPGGAWTYGWSLTRGSGFIPYEVCYPASSAPACCAPYSGMNFPVLGYNEKDLQYTIGTVVYPPLSFFLHPRNDGANSILRWTAPADGAFLVQGRFFGSDDGAGTTTDVAVLVNTTTTIASGRAWAYHDGMPFGFVRNLRAGDTVDFTVGNGGNGYDYDTTGLFVSVTQAGPAHSTASFDKPGDYFLRLTGYDGEYFNNRDIRVTVKAPPVDPLAPVVDAGPAQAITLPDNHVPLNGSATDPKGATLTIQWSQVDGPWSVQFDSLTSPVSGATFVVPGIYTLRLTARNSQRTSTSDVMVVVSTKQNRAPLVDAGGTQTITLPSTATLAGRVADDGLPPGRGAPTTLWYKVSGPGNVSFSAPTQLQTQAAFDLPGVYVIGLKASDSILSTTATVTINVNPGTNQAPVVTVPVPQNIGILNNTITLAGSVTDDGFPAGGTLTVQWSQVSGPAAVSFATPAQAVTQATFPQVGTYVLQLNANDSQLTTTASTTVIVSTGQGLNQPPSVSAGANQTLTLPNNLNLNGTAADDGLPNNTLTLSWTVLSGPGTVTFSNPNQAATQATFTVPGIYQLQLSASDSQLTSRATVAVTVFPPGTDNQPPTVSAGPTLTITLPATQATLRGTASDDGRPASVLNVQWSQVSGPGAVTFSTPNSPVTQATFPGVGNYVLQLSASDTQATATTTTTVTVQAQPAPAPVVIISLADGSEITKPTPINGSVSNGTWSLGYAPNSRTNTLVFTTFASGTGAAGGTLGTFDPTMLLNGSYTIRLIATDDAAQSSMSSATVEVRGGMKVGNFTLAFNDLTVPMPGLPIQIVRTYDSRDKNVGDFGVGWTLSLRNVRVEKSRVIGKSWYEETGWASFQTQYCLAPTSARNVTITFPDGRVYRFAVQSKPECQGLGAITVPVLAFVQQPTDSSTAGAKLTAVGDTNLLIDGAVPGPVNIVDYNGNYADYTRFVLTTAEGYTYYLDQKLGATSVVDPNGNILTIDDNGVSHSSGLKVAFHRDGQNRITSIDDPSGVALQYEYDGNGDLVSFTDRASNRTTFAYDPDHPHYLQTIHDPRGVQAIKNVYDDSGRLTSTTDAAGKTIQYQHNLTEHQEIVTDRMQNPTVYEYDDDGNIIHVVDAEGGETFATYDVLGNKLTEHNSVVSTVSHSYDKRSASLQSQTRPTDQWYLPSSRCFYFGCVSLKQLRRLMDILAHTLWTAGAALPLRRRLRRPLSLSWSIFWGVFADVVSFAIPALVRIWWYLSGTTSSLLPDRNGPQHFRFVWTLYYASHSLLVFGLVFAIAWLLAKRPILEMLAWGLHILIDIPTHQGIFALHFLWPLSSYGISGLRWENHWFLSANYAALFLLYSWMWIGARRRRLLTDSR